MALNPFPCVRTPSSPSASLIFSFRPTSSYQKRIIVSAKIPARDRIIDFGKYKGKMLGTLPSKYLKWVSVNLRARDFEDWAKLADEVLGDPVYRDRLEWESVERILRGDDYRSSRTETPVSDLAEISDRFGWDNENKAAWSRINFGLLGTSKGGRIPRIGGTNNREMATRSQKSKMNTELRLGRRLEFPETKSGAPGIDELGSKNFRKSVSLTGLSGASRVGVLSSSKKDSRFRNSRNLSPLDNEFNDQGEGTPYFLQDDKVNASVSRKVGFLISGSRRLDAELEDSEEEDIRGRREERRERLRLRRDTQMQKLKGKIGVKDGIDSSKDVLKMTHQKQGNFNPFPGRESLLRKVKKLQD